MMPQCTLVLEVRFYSRDDIKNDESFGFKIIHCDEFQTEGTDKIVERIKKRVGDNPLYLSIDIDVLGSSICSRNRDSRDCWHDHKRDG
jgi:arginase family enzyme